MTFTAPQTGKKPYALKIEGLVGGHSGIEINKGRANAIKLLMEVVEDAVKNFGVQVGALAGGEKMNAIPKRAEALLWVGENEVSDLMIQVKTQLEAFRAEYKEAEPAMTITLSAGVEPERDTVLSPESVQAAIALVKGIPTGVQSMCADIEGLVESSNNLGVLSLEDKTLTLDSAVRSSVKALKEGINQKIQSLCDEKGAAMELIADYPAWPYNPVSPIRDLMQNIYEDKFGKPAEVSAIHAGLECGFLKEKVGEMDMISLGPNMWDVHTPQEHLSISSTERVYSFLCDVLKNINTLG
jgi:dipeptidase D